MKKINTQIFLLLLIVFFTVPLFLQFPLKVLIAIIIILIFSNFNKIKLSIYQSVYIIILVILFFYQTKLNYFSSSFVNIIISSLFIFYIVKFPNFQINKNYIYFIKILLNLINIVWIFQTLIYAYDNFSMIEIFYEKNYFGFYTFLLFVTNYLFKNKLGLIFLFPIIFIVQSRALLLSIIIFYLIIFLYKFKIIISIYRHPQLLIFLTLLITLLMPLVLFGDGMPEVSYETGINRLYNYIDGSNYLRFISNLKLIDYLFEESNYFLLGFGEVNDLDSRYWQYDFAVMPHNEIFYSLASFGLIFTLLSFLFVSRLFKFYLNNSFNAALFTSLLAYSSTLWVKALIIPSYEMAFIFIIMSIAFAEKSSTINAFESLN